MKELTRAQTPRQRARIHKKLWPFDYGVGGGLTGDLNAQIQPVDHEAEPLCEASASAIG